MIFTILSHVNNISLFQIPDFTFKYIDFGNITSTLLLSVLIIYLPVSLAGLCEHISDHKVLSNIIKTDLTTDPGLDKTLIGSNPNITHPIASLLERSFASNPMERPTLEKWKETLRSSLDEFVFCPKCKEWHPRNVDKNCPFCDTRSMFDIKLSIGTLGEGEVYDPETNALHVEKTIIGKCRWDIALNESTSKILYAYHFGIKNNPDIPIAVITVTNCNDNNEMTLCVTPMLNTRITHVDPNYEMIGIPFNEQTNIEFDRNLISDSVFLVENNMFKNKIIKLCHI